MVAVADAFDAMTSERPYRAPMPTEKAFLELEEKSGSHFDPECARAFLRVRGRVQAMLAEETPVPAFLEPLSSGVLHREAMAMLRPAGSILAGSIS